MVGNITEVSFAGCCFVLRSKMKEESEYSNYEHLIIVDTVEELENIASLIQKMDLNIETLETVMFNQTSD